MNRIRILVVETGQKPKEMEISDRLEVMQAVVGGLIQVLYPFDDPVAVVANDEGKLLGLPMNRALRDEDGNIYDILCGTFFLSGIEEDRLVSLTDEQMQKFAQIYAVPEIFVNINGHLFVLPMPVDNPE